MSKPTGYTVTLEAEALLVYLKWYGAHSTDERVSTTNITQAQDDIAATTWHQLVTKLEEDGWYEY